MYKINVNVHRWKKEQVVSEEELVGEGIVIEDWLDKKLILKIGEVKKKEDLDLNGDGKVDAKDASIASKVMNKVKKSRKKKGKR